MSTDIQATVDQMAAPLCERCGAHVHGPCLTDEAQAKCDLPAFCFGKDKDGDALKEAAVKIARLRAALVEIIEEVGTSTKANKIASAALSQS